VEIQTAPLPIGTNSRPIRPAQLPPTKPSDSASFIQERSFQAIDCAEGLPMQTGKHLQLAGSVLGCLISIALVSRPAGAQTNFGEVNFGASASSSVPIQIPTAATLTGIAVVTQGASNLDFSNAGGGTCAAGVAYAANATCTVQVTFAPQFAGARYGAVVLTDATGVVGTTYLQGTGIGPQVTFEPDSQSTVGHGGYPLGVAVDGSGNVYFTSSSQPFPLLKETLSNGSYIQSVVPTSPLGNPFGVAVDGAGNVYVADCDHFRVLKETVTPSGYAESTVASFPAVDGSTPVGVAVDGSGNVFISVGVDAGIVYKETLTAAGYEQSTVVSGLPADAGVAVDGDGDVYVAVNETGGWIVKATPSAGGYTQSTIPVTGNGVPIAVAVDGSGDLYIAFTDNNDDGQVFMATLTADGYSQSTIPTSGLNQPSGIAVDGSGNVYVGDYGGGRIVKETLAVPPSLSFATTALGSTSSDSPQTVTVSNFGNADLTFSALSYPADFPENSGATHNCTAGNSLAAEGSCALAIDFTPVTPLNDVTSAVLTESVKITTNAIPETQSMTVTGTETALPTATPTFSPAAGTYPSGQPVAIGDATAGATIYYTTDGTTPTTSSTVFSGPIVLVSSETIEAIAAANDYASSAVASAAYAIPADFTFSINPASIIIQAGQQSGTSAITVQDEGGFNGNITFACSGLPAGAACSFSLETLPTDVGVSYTTLTVTTSASRAASVRSLILPGSALAVAFCFLGVGKRRRFAMLLSTLLLMVASGAGLGLLSGCSAVLLSDPQPVTSTVTVTAASGSLQHTETFLLTVK
jgi:hypothetical protein